VKSKKIIIALSVILALSLALNANLLYRVNRIYRGETIDYLVDTGDLAPDFSVPLMTGETFTLSEHRGTVVVLEFWTTWCVHCVLKVPIIQELSEQFAGDAIFVGINLGESPAIVQAFIDEHAITYPIGLDYDLAIHRDLYPSPGIPYMVIIDRNGAITTTFTGGSPDAHAQISNAVLEAMGEE